MKQHPILGATVDGPESEQPRFRRIDHLSLKSHLYWLDLEDVGGSHIEEDRLVERAVQHVMNIPFGDVRRVPPWKLFIMPLKPCRAVSSNDSRYLVLFNYSHSHGDGLSGLVFQRTFMAGLSDTPSVTGGAEPDAVATSEKDLPRPPSPLPISWSFLSRIVVKEYLPWLSSWFTNPYHGTPVWTGSPTFSDNNVETRIKLLPIEANLLNAAMNNWRPHGVKLTAILHLAICRALTTELKAAGIRSDSLTSSTPLDLRSVFGLDPNTMGVCASAIEHRHSAIGAGQRITAFEISSAQQQTRDLAHAASTKQDQLLGLLEYAKPLRTWQARKIGRARDITYEVSNVMSFDPPYNQDAVVERLVFGQPADASGQALSFNIVSLRGGSLEIVISWQIGALGLSGSAAKRESDEEMFIARMATTLHDEFAFLSSGPSAGE